MRGGTPGLVGGTPGGLAPGGKGMVSSVYRWAAPGVACAGGILLAAGGIPPGGRGREPGGGGVCGRFESVISLLDL